MDDADFRSAYAQLHSRQIPHRISALGWSFALGCGIMYIENFIERVYRMVVARMGLAGHFA